MPRLVEVALPVPLYQNFAYEFDEDRDLVAGTRVIVPFSGRRDVGIVTGASPERKEGQKYKSILSVPDAVPALTPALMETCGWIARHYVAPLGVVLRSALPARLTSPSVPTPPVKTRRLLVITAELESLAQRDKLFARAPRQREVYELLEAMGGKAPLKQVISQLAVGEAVVRALAKRGLVSMESESVMRDPFGARGDGAQEPALHTPTSAQKSAIDKLLSAQPGSVTLLHGVTGSGKTLVYLEVLKRRLAEPGSSAIVLVPEIALTPQTVSRFRGVFGDQVAVLHSALSDGERHDAWAALRKGERRIAVGARSAIFAPLEGVKVIVVDEEHEDSYKQGETPRYHARDVAVARGAAEGATVVLGSATPALESWSRVDAGQYSLVELRDRVGGGVLPSVEVVDLKLNSRPMSERGAPPEKESNTHPSPRRHSLGSDATGAQALPQRLPAPQPPPLAQTPFRRVISESLERAIRDRIGRHEQTILLLNRRGYSAFLHCTACDYVAQCPNCSISLTYHRTPERLTCHYCLYTEPPHTVCRRCGANTIKQRGLGTQQVERLLGEWMPSIRIARMDVDTTSGKWAHADILGRVARGDVDILLGTQMIAKGLDFPNVTLVGVIDADVGINLPDYRSSERTYQLLAQVAGRAGRSTKGGHVIIQTRLGSHHAVQCAVTHDYNCFVTQELQQRHSPPYPPTTSLANVIVSGEEEQKVYEGARDAAAWLNRLIQVRSLDGVEVVGPAPSPVERIKQRWRWHLLVRSPNSRQLTQVLHYFATRFKPQSHASLRITIDRDPTSLL